MHRTRDIEQIKNLEKVELDKVRTQSQQQQTTGEQQLAAQRTRILELESMAHDAARELDSYKLQVDNMNKSKPYYKFSLKAGFSIISRLIE